MRQLNDIETSAVGGGSHRPRLIPSPLSPSPDFWSQSPALLDPFNPSGGISTHPPIDIPPPPGAPKPIPGNG